MLTPWKESYDQSRQHIKSRDITLSTKVHLLKAMVFQWSCMIVSGGLSGKLSAEKLMLLNGGVVKDA